MAGLGGALLLGGAGSARAAATIEAVTVRPGYFTPDGDDVTDSSEISFVPGGAAASVTVQVEVRRDADDVLVDTLVPAASFPQGVALVRSWAPGAIADGRYRFDILVVDAADSAFASAIVVADTTNPDVTLGVLAPNPFDPASDPPANVLTIPFSVVSDSTTATSVRVLTIAGAFVDSLGVLVGPGSSQLAWDGRDATNAAAVSGPYRVHAIATDLAGNADSTSQTITLDREAPQFLALADSLQTDQLPFLISASATDVDRVTAVTISTDGGSTFVAVDTMDPPGPQVDWSTSVALPGATPGFFPLIFRATDALAHTAQQTVVLAYDTVLPVPVASLVLGDGTVEDGETVQVETQWNLPDLDVSANFALLDFAYAPGAETVREGPPGTYVLTYRVSPSNIRSSGTKQIVITASTGIVAGQDTVSVVLVDAGPRDDELVAINHNRFDPEAHERVSISAIRPSDGVTVDVYNLAGQRIRHLAGSGFVEWDGTNEAGEICGSGVYHLQVAVDDETETRRVAIVRGVNR
ncbi:MAG: T9SS type A sorting domain-containing protein [Actinobacteria bacterium]|nr:T9SS type A sorting domain-containing protein [Actinomycetota bacterium]